MSKLCLVFVVIPQAVPHLLFLDFYLFILDCSCSNKYAEVSSNSYFQRYLFNFFPLVSEICVLGIMYFYFLGRLEDFKLLQIGKHDYCVLNESYAVPANIFFL